MAAWLASRLILALPLVLGGAIGAAGCGDDFETGTPPGSSGTGGTGTGGEGGSGGTQVTPTDCIPDEATGPLGADCGLFVSSSLGDNANAGTMEAPLATIGEALELSEGEPIYLCAETFDEAATITAPVEIYGGLDCDDGWSWLGGTEKTLWTAPAGSVVAKFRAEADGSILEDVELSAKAATAPGDSSIAAVVDQATVTFERCDLVAADAMAGENGSTPSGTAPGGLTGNEGAAACTGTVAKGGAQVSRTCGAAVSVGAQGGDGGTTSGGNGANGQPADAVTGQGGDGQYIYTNGTSWSCSDNGTGGEGKAGTVGTAGVGGKGIGHISPQGYEGSSGANGEAGTPGQGGGGGGGTRSYSDGGLNQCGTIQAGAGGGSGGSGGCGGQGGTAGRAGGSSIALVSLHASVTLVECTLHAGDGGNGGTGGTGQQGGQGGPGGSGGSGTGSVGQGCFGGRGGNGGAGGPAGGGQGGHSLGIAFEGALPTGADAATITFGTRGSGGDPGGTTATPTGTGDDGRQAAHMTFDALDQG